MVKNTMIHLRLTYELIIYLMVIVISSGIPILLFERYKLGNWACVLISLGLTLLLINLGNMLPPLFPEVGAQTKELYKLVLLIPPIIVGIVVNYRRKRHGKDLVSDLGGKSGTGINK